MSDTTNKYCEDSYKMFGPVWERTFCIRVSPETDMKKYYKISINLKKEEEQETIRNINILLGNIDGPPSADTTTPEYFYTIANN